LIRLRWSRWSIENGDTKAIACAAAAKSELEHDLCRSLVAICQTLGTAPAMSNSKHIPLTIGGPLATVSSFGQRIHSSPTRH
jgi:hypothetical protein